jgi:hypothetical protein
VSVRRGAIVAVTLCLVSPASAQDVQMLGPGSGSSCGRWLETRRSDTWHFMASWALGFLSGGAVFSHDMDPLNGRDTDAVLYWLDNYCRNHPVETFPHAVTAFAREHPR